MCVFMCKVFIWTSIAHVNELLTFLTAVFLGVSVELLSVGIVDHFCERSVENSSLILVCVSYT